MLDPACEVVRSQLDVIFVEERIAHASCPYGGKTVIFEQPEETEYIEEINSGDGLPQAQHIETGADGLLQAQDNGTSGDGLLHVHTGSSRTGEGHGSRDHNCTDDYTDHILPDADSHRCLPASTGVISRPHDEEDAPPVSSEIIVQNRHFRREHDLTYRTAAISKQSCQPQPPLTNHVTRSQVKISANAVIIMAKALASTSIHSAPFTYATIMGSPQRDNWNLAMEVECTSILLNNTFTTINSREARQLQVKPIGSRWVYTTKLNPGRTIQYKAHLVITDYEETDFGDPYALVRKFTTVWYLISLVQKHGLNIAHLDVVTAGHDPGINDNDICMTLPEGWPEGLSQPAIIIQLKKTLYGLKQAPSLWHDNDITCLLSL